VSITQALYRAARLSADARAVRRGRIPQRAYNKAIGRANAKLMRRLWR
jgi:hypothetical protein